LLLRFCLRRSSLLLAVIPNPVALSANGVRDLLLPFTSP
jgi:hypothetical protein